MPAAPLTSDVSLDVAFARGEADLHSVYEEHGPFVYAVCRKALGESEAGEVTQDVFVSAWQARSQYDPDRGALRGWLVGIAKRKIIDHARREQRHVGRRADTPVPVETMELPAAADGDSIERVVQRMTVAEALRSIPERPRQLITLAYVHGLTHQEIAERTRIPLGTVKSDIRRGLLTLRTGLETTDD